MTFLKDYFILIFQFGYPLIHNHLVSYTLFFLFFVYLARKVWVLIKKTPQQKNALTYVIKVSLVCVELFLLLFLAWFLLDHFRTFSQLP